MTAVAVVPAVVVRHRRQSPDGIFVRAWLGLGANLQQPLEQLKLALDRLNQSSAVKLVEVSPYYETPPWGDEQQNNFINAVAHIETSLEPLQLLHFLQSIENEMGRSRDGRRWGPRLIDIDLLLFDGYSCKSAELELPHPRMHERAFVLLPLSDLDAGLEIPGCGTVRSLLSQLNCDGIQRLDEEFSG